MEPLRILHVFGILNHGGAETMIMNYYRRIDRQLIQFDFLVYCGSKGLYEDEILNLGGKVYKIPRLENFVNHRKEVIRFFQKHDYKIVHGHIGAACCYIFKVAKEQCHAKVIAHAHTSSAMWSWKLPIILILKYFMRRFVDIKVACSLNAGKWLFGKGGSDKLHLIANAIDVSKFSYNADTRLNVRKILKWENCFVIGYVARFNAVKNHDFLLKVYQHVRERLDNACLVLIGAKKGLYEQIKKTAEDLGMSDSVIFLGARDDVADILQGVDVFCFPSIYEGFGMCAIEAQCAGLRVVKSEGVPDSVNICSDLVASRNLKDSYSDWADELLKTYVRSDRSAQIRTAGFDIADNVSKLVKLYNSL